MAAWSNLEIERVVAKTPATTIYRLSGAFTDCAASYRLLEHVREEAGSGTKTILLNLAGSNHITSGGIGVIAACYTSLKSRDGRLVLVGVHPRYQALLNVVGLWDSLEHYDTEEASGVS